MQIISLDDFLESTGFGNLIFDDFWDLGNATSLSKENNGEQLEFSRGPLLYALVGFLKPKRILEFGTGGGYSTLCMAKALNDFKIDGKIFTIDRVGNNEKIPRFYKLPSDDEAHENNISNKEIWKSIVPHELIDKIIPIQGYSGIVMGTKNFDDIDFCYVDGVHSYEGTKHDFFSFLKNAPNSFSVLFDDYIARDFYGVKEFIDKEVAPNFKLQLIKTDTNKDLEKFSKIKHDYGMVFLNHQSTFSPMKNYDKKKIDDFLKKYRINDHRIRSIRYNLEKKIPFLNKIKFKFWK